MKAKEIKRMASQSIKSRGASLFVGTVMFLICVTFFKQIEMLLKINSTVLLLLISVIFIVLERPLRYGFTAMYVNKRNGEDVKFFDFFKSGFKNFTRAWSITLRLIPKYIIPIICVLISSILICVPLYKSIDKIKELWNTQPIQDEIIYTSSDIVMTEATVIIDGIEYTERDFAPVEVDKFSLDFIIEFVTNIFATILIESVSVIIALILMSVAFIFTIILLYKYRYCYINANINKHLTTKEVVEKTGEIMVGNKFKSFGLDFSFILRFMFFGILSFMCVNTLVFAPQIIKLIIESIISALCVVKYYMSHVVFFEDKC